MAKEKIERVVQMTFDIGVHHGVSKKEIQHLEKEIIIFINSKTRKFTSFNGMETATDITTEYEKQGFKISK